MSPCLFWLPWVTHMCEPPGFCRFPSRLATDPVGNEAGNDLKKSWIPFLCFHNPSTAPFWTHQRPRPAYPGHFKDAGDRVLHHGSGDHWCADYMSGSWEKCPLISALQREAFKPCGWGGGWVKAEFPAGKRHPTFCRLVDPTERSDKSLQFT